MARIRTIKPEFPQSESIGRLSRDARLLFIQLWTIADDSGRARASSRMLASLLYPYDDDAPKLIPKWLCELEREGCIRRYVIEGSTYLDIPKWLNHQKIDRPSASRLPQFVEASRALDEPSATDLGPRKGPRTIERSSGDDLAHAFEEFWKVYPRKVSKGSAKGAFRTALTKTSLPSILAALQRARWPEPKFIPHAATWLNGERWLDAETQAEPERTPAELYAIRKRAFVAAGGKTWLEHWGPRPETETEQREAAQ